MTTLVSLTAVLLTVMAMLALAPLPARAADETNPSGTIIENRVTTATINPAKNSATISGTIQCSTPTQVEVYGAVRQSHGANYRLAEYFGASWVACGATPTPYTVTVTPGYQSARLVPGNVSANAWATYCDTTRCYGLGYTADVRLVLER